MKKYLRLLVLLVILGFFVMGQSGCTRWDNTGSLIVTVKDEYTDQPIEGAVILVKGVSPFFQTNLDGQCRITNLPEGFFCYVWVSKQGYYTEFGFALIEAGKTTTLDFLLTPATTSNEIIYDTTTIQPGEYKYWTADLNENDLIDVYIIATGKIHIYLLDETNYQKLVNGQSITAYFGADVEDSYYRSYNIPTSQRYYFVIKSKEAQFRPAVHIEVERWSL